MKFKDYLKAITDPQGFIPTPHLRWVIRKNKRSTAREEAIAAKILEDANPRQNITGHFPWGPEQQFVLQQLWNGPNSQEWRDVPIAGASKLFTTQKTKHGPLPVPNAVREPGQIRANLRKRLRETLDNKLE